MAWNRAERGKSFAVPLAHLPTFRRMIPIEITYDAKKNTTPMSGRPSSSTRKVRVIEVQLSMVTTWSRVYEAIEKLWKLSVWCE